MNVINFGTIIFKFSKLQPRGCPDFKDRDVINFWYEEFGSLDEQVFVNVMKKLCAGKFFPCLDEVKQALGDKINPVDVESLARDAVKRIDSAIRSYGYLGWNDARQKIGSLGEYLVQMSGGWESLCSAETESEHSIRIAQLREFAKVAIQKDAVGARETPPELPSVTKSNQAMVIAEKLAQSLQVAPKDKMNKIDLDDICF